MCVDGPILFDYAMVKRAIENYTSNIAGDVDAYRFKYRCWERFIKIFNSF